jgi:hypothetical protein
MLEITDIALPILADRERFSARPLTRDAARA